MTTHTAGQIISVVTVQAADRPAAVAVVLAVVSAALKPCLPGLWRAGPVRWTGAGPCVPDV